MKTIKATLFTLSLITYPAIADVVSLKFEPTGHGDRNSGRSANGIASVGEQRIPIDSDTRLMGLNSQEGIAGPITFTMKVKGLVIEGSEVGFSFDVTLTPTGGNIRTDGGKLKGFVVTSGNPARLDPDEAITYKVSALSGLPAGFVAGPVTFSGHTGDGYVASHGTAGLQLDTKSGKLTTPASVRPRVLEMHVNIEKSSSGSAAALFGIGDSALILRTQEK